MPAPPPPPPPRNPPSQAPAPLSSHREHSRHPAARRRWRLSPYRARSTRPPTRARSTRRRGRVWGEAPRGEARRQTTPGERPLRQERRGKRRAWRHHMGQTKRRRSRDPGPRSSRLWCPTTRAPCAHASSPGAWRWAWEMRSDGSPGESASTEQSIRLETRLACAQSRRSIHQGNWPQGRACHPV